MDVTQALAELVELSSQVTRAVVLDGDGSVLGTTGDPAEGEELARVALDLLAAASDLRSEPAEVTRAEVELADGGLFVIRAGGRTIAATTGAAPTAGLVAYDLRTCLDRIGEAEKPKGRRAATRAKERT
jgi:predicted regulator of Ras-like GTPase activity (Roadblock/LC7/MglB family)